MAAMKAGQLALFLFALQITSALCQTLVSSQEERIFIDPCTLGPSYWCRSLNNQRRCDVVNTTVGVQGYGSKNNYPVMTVPEFCATNPNALTWNGGLVGAPATFDTYTLALYWAPSSCLPDSAAGGGFCSNYTTRGTHAATNLVLHGLWPNYGQIYDPIRTQPKPPTFAGAYEGWGQWCNSPYGHFSQCAVGGGLCPLPAAQFQNFTQSNYEACMREFGVRQCLVPQSVFNALDDQWKTYAPGYLGSNRTFVDHEFHKHGTCVGGHLTIDKETYFRESLAQVKANTKPGTPAHDFVATNIGKSVPFTTLQKAFTGPVLLHQYGQYATLQCNDACELSEVWYCVSHDAGGYPGALRVCNVGDLVGDTCVGYCPNVTIPAYPA